jgi:hypothetical protein
MAAVVFEGSVTVVNTLAALLLLPLASHVGQDQFGRFPFVGDDDILGGGGTSWGVVLPDVEHGGWGRVCEEAFGPALFFALRQPGRVLLGGLDGLSVTSDDGCSYQRLENELAHRYASALWMDPDDNQHLLIGTSTPTADNGVWESFDGGNTFRSLLAARPGNVFSIAAAADTVHMALAGNDGAGRVLLLMSNDGGASFVDVSAALADRPVIHALLFDGDTLVLGGINGASEGTIDRVRFDGSTATTTVVGTTPRETTHAALFAGKLFVLARNGARGEVYVQNDSPLGFGLVQGGPTDCLFRHGDALWGCGKQGGLNTALFLRSDDGVQWREVVAFRDVHYRICPEATPGYAACGIYLETACADGVDNEVDGYRDCDDDDCAFHPACLGGTGEGEGEGGRNGDNDDTGPAVGPGDASTCAAGLSPVLPVLGLLLTPRQRRRRRR